MSRLLRRFNMSETNEPTKPYRRFQIDTVCGGRREEIALEIPNATHHTARTAHQTGFDQTHW